MKKTLLAIAIAAAAASAQADVKLSGHVNYVFGDLEDFNNNEDLTINDAVTSQSRFRIVADKEADGITYGLREEFGLNDGALAIRVNEFWLKGSFGKISLGQGSEAGDGLGELDFSGTYVLTGAGYNSWGLSGDIGQIDGGRDERLRYDTPKLGGIATVSLDVDTNDDTTIAVKAGNKMFKAGIYAEQREADDSDEIGGSVALNFSGFTVALQSGKRDESANGANDELEISRVILGYRSGPISVALDASTREVDGGDVTDNSTTGLSFVYRPTKGVELYAGVRSAEADEGTPFGLNNDEDDGSALLVGGRVKF